MQFRTTSLFHSVALQRRAIRVRGAAVARRDHLNPDTEAGERDGGGTEPERLVVRMRCHDDDFVAIR